MGGYKNHSNSVHIHIAASAFHRTFKKLLLAKMKVFAILILVVAAASAGRIDHVSCTSNGVLHEFRIDDVPDGAVAILQPGTPYVCHGDLTPRETHGGLNLKVTATYLGFPITIIEVTLENSAVDGGARYTITFRITPNDILSGNRLPILCQVSGVTAPANVFEACGTIQVQIA